MRLECSHIVPDTVKCVLGKESAAMTKLYRSTNILWWWLTKCKYKFQEPKWKQSSCPKSLIRNNRWLWNCWLTPTLTRHLFRCATFSFSSFKFFIFFISFLKDLIFCSEINRKITKNKLISLKSATILIIWFYYEKNIETLILFNTIRLESIEENKKKIKN